MRMNLKIDKFAVTFLSLLLLYQILCTVQGFDLTDEGFLMNAYRWFGEDPNACKDSGGYTFSCLLGWYLHGLYPNGGVLMMRLWGVLLVFITELIVFAFLSNIIEKRIALCGVLLMGLFIAGNPKPFDYNNLTALFIICSFILIHKGLLSKKFFMLFWGGVIIGSSVFLRLPNLLFSLFIIAPFVLEGEKLHTRFIQSLFIFIGIIVGVIGIWGLLSIYNANHLITDYIAFTGNTLNGNSTHQFSHMLSKYADNYWTSVIMTCVFCSSILLSTYISKFNSKIFNIFFFLITAEFIYYNVYIGGNIMGQKILALYNGIGILGCGYYIYSRREYRFVSICALIISFISPLGSDCGFETTWTGTWLSLPVGLSGIYQMCKNIAFIEIATQCISKKKHSLRMIKLDKAFGYSLFFIFIPTFVKTEHKPYYDPGNRDKKIYPINNKFTRYIYTEKERANIVNPLLRELPKYVKAGDTFFQHDFSRLLYYMMDAKPFTGVSWSCVLYGDRFIKEFKQAEQNMKKPPVVVLQHFWDSNKWSGIIPNYFNEQLNTGFICAEHTKIVKKFIRKYKYKIVWTNKYYDIWVSDM